MASSSSWKAKNDKFKRFDTHQSPSHTKDVHRKKKSQWRNKEGDRGHQRGPELRNQSFRENFVKTRVFVEGIPNGVDWKKLKDHFKIAGEVVFASVSIDSTTGMSKGCGVVQYETTEMASNAIKIMRDYPMEGKELFVREDFQEKRGDGSNQFGSTNARRGGGEDRTGRAPLSVWRCADEENASHLPLDQYLEIENLIKVRDSARWRKDYEESDAMREELKEKHSVHLDDRLKTWWYSFDNSVPGSISKLRGNGKWSSKPWRQIPTTPENDACVSADVVNRLLKQRDIARKEKDFKTADALLEKAKTSPDGDLNLHIHDEDRTWRIWTLEPPSMPVEQQVMSGVDKCISLVMKHEPEKIEEIKNLLEKFPGREYKILKKLKDNYYP